MSYSKAKKYLLVLSFIFFFVLFLPITGSLNVVLAKDLTTKEDTTTKEVLPEIKLNVNSRELVKGKSFQLKVYNTSQEQAISYKTSNADFVSVTDTGLVKALEIGNATITITVREGSKIVTTLQCEITVGVPALSVRITKSNLVLVVGQSTTLRVLVAPFNTVEEVRFTNLGSKNVSVTTGGRIKALEPGVAFVYALIDNGYSRCKVSVISEETYNALVDLGITDLTKITNLEEVLPATEGAIKATGNNNSDKASNDTKTE